MVVAARSQEESKVNARQQVLLALITNSQMLRPTTVSNASNRLSSPFVPSPRCRTFRTRYNCPQLRAAPNPRMSMPAPKPVPKITQPTLSAMTGLDRLNAKRRDMTHLANLLGSEQTCIVALVGTKPVIRSPPDRTSAALATFTRDTCPGGPPHLEDVQFLGIHTRTGQAIFVRSYSPPEAECIDPEGAFLSPAVDLRSLAMQGVLSSDDLAIAATAAALVNWHASSSFCGRCGSQTTSRDGGWLRYCSACDHSIFPRTDPVVIMLVTSGDQCVLARQATFPEGMASALAGFLEPGETIEAAITRETEEEIGILVDEVRYLASQPWPFPHSLMIGCLATARHHPLTVDPDELESARWVPRAEVRQMLAGAHPLGIWVPGPHAIAHTLISHFAYGEG